MLNYEVLQERYNALKAMNTLVRLMNDEGAYAEWCFLIPDQADDEELFEIAAYYEETFEEAAEMFNSLVNRFASHSGYYMHKLIDTEIDAVARNHVYGIVDDEEDDEGDDEEC